MAGGTDNNQLKSAAKTRWQWRQQLVNDDEEDDDDDDDEHDKHDNDDDDDDKHNKHDNDKHGDKDHDDNNNVGNDDDDYDNDEADTVTAVGGDNNGGNSNGLGHRQQSTKIGSKDTVAVATAIH